MLAEARKAVRVTTTSFDDELMDLIHAGIKDLQLPGIHFDVILTTSDVTIPDPLAKKAVITYVKCNFGNPSNYDKLKASYDEQKGQMRGNSNYIGDGNG